MAFQHHRHSVNHAFFRATRNKTTRHAIHTSSEGIKTIVPGLDLAINELAYFIRRKVPRTLT